MISTALVPKKSNFLLNIVENCTDIANYSFIETFCSIAGFFYKKLALLNKNEFSIAIGRLCRQ